MLMNLKLMKNILKISLSYLEGKNSKFIFDFIMTLVFHGKIRKIGIITSILLVFA